MKLHFARTVATLSVLTLTMSLSAFAGGDHQEPGTTSDETTVIEESTTESTTADPSIGSEPGTAGSEDLSGTAYENRKKSRKKKGETTDQTGSTTGTDGSGTSSGTSGSGTGTSQ